MKNCKMELFRQFLIRLERMLMEILAMRWSTKLFIVFYVFFGSFKGENIVWFAIYDRAQHVEAV